MKANEGDKEMKQEIVEEGDSVEGLTKMKWAGFSYQVSYHDKKKRK